jgi:hypothetical protein
VRLACWAIDYDGNHVIFDELYVEEPSPHLPSDIIPLVAERRADWWPDGARPGRLRRPGRVRRRPDDEVGRPPAFSDEFENAGMPLQRANNDRKSPATSGSPSC